MVILIPMPSSTGAGLGPWRDRPSKIGLSASAVLLAGYLSIPLYDHALFIDLPKSFGIEVSTFSIGSFSMIFTIVLAMAYVFTALFTLLGGEKVHWWEWTLYCASLGLVLFWILPLIAAGEALNADFCREIGRFGSDAWSAGCY